MFQTFAAIILSLIFCVNGLSEKALKDKITSLPGQPGNVDFDQYGGYITVDSTTNRSLFYWFQESSTGAETSPIVLWTNGGPGCSGLAGALIEQGAFRIQNTGDLIMNEGRWNQIANMLFIEQPVGVGFSYSDSSTDYNTGDSKSVADMYTMIINFLTEFSDYSNNDFYIASESYGGHYMPLLATYIVEHNTKNEINFKGFLVGNPLTDMNENARGMYDTWYGHSLISYPLWNSWYVGCNDGENQNETCQGLMNAMADQVSDVYPYGLDWPNCDDSGSLYSFKMRSWFMEKVIEGEFGRKMPFKKWEHFDNEMINNLDENERRRILGDNEYQACAVDYMTTYLNRQDVQTAIHAKVGTDWQLCSNVTNYNYSDVSNPMEPYYKFLIDGGYGLHITIYSGDDDSVCGTLGTQSWIWELGYDTESKWQAWQYDDQTAGYYVKFSYNDATAFTFVTIHSAGHQVPWFKPNRGFEMFTKYLNGDF